MIKILFVCYGSRTTTVLCLKYGDKTGQIKAFVVPSYYGKTTIDGS